MFNKYQELGSYACSEMYKQVYREVSDARSELCLQPAMTNKPMKTCRDEEGVDNMGIVLYSEYLKDLEPKWTFW